MNINSMHHALLRDEIRIREEEVLGEKMSIVSYMVATPDLWDVPNAIEARGITFDENGNCVCRTMEKFFNINENKHTQLSDLDFDGAIAYDKLDGSMISVVQIGDKLICKTKKSFYSDVAKSAQAFFDARPNYKHLCSILLAKGFTPTFEFESPDSQIVVEQKEDKMTLLMARDIATGRYFEYDALQLFAASFGIPLVEYVDGSDIQKFITLAETIEGIEGWVFLLKSGQRVKLKTQWYLKRHRLTSYHERNIFDLIIDEEIDDIMPLLEQKDGAVDIVNEIGHRIAHYMLSAEMNARALVDEWNEKQLSLPEIGSQYNTNPLFSLAIKLYKGQEPDYKKWVVNKYRNEFHTRPVFWGFDTDA